VDSLPNYHVEQQRLRAQLAAQRSKIEEQKLTILEMADRKTRHEENIAAAERAIAEYAKQLAALEATHGALTDATYETMRAGLADTTGVIHHG